MPVPELRAGDETLVAYCQSRTEIPGPQSSTLMSKLAAAKRCADRDRRASVLKRILNENLPLRVARIHRQHTRFGTAQLRVQVPITQVRSDRVANDFVRAGQ